MIRLQKKYAGAIATVAICTVFLSALLVFSDFFLNRASLTNRIKAIASTRLKTAIEFDRLELSLFFTPHIILKNVGFNTADKASGTVRSLKVYPSLFHLLRGNIHLARIILDSPDILLTLPRKMSREQRPPNHPTPTDSLDKATTLISQILSLFPDSVFHMTNGRLALIDQSETVFRFDDIQASGDKAGAIRLSCRSNLFETLNVEARRVNPRLFKNRGRIELKDFRPHLLTQYFQPDAPLGMADSSLDLDIHFLTDGIKVFKIQTKGVISSLTLLKKQKIFSINGGRVSVDWFRNPKQTRVQLNSLELKNPKATLTGSFVMDHQLTETPPVMLEVSGTEADLTSIRDLTLFIWRDHPVVQKVCRIVNQGTAPSVSVTSSGRSISELGDLDNLVIKASVDEARVRLPRIGWNLQEVKGEVLISGGILEGNDLEGAFQDCRTRNSVLRLGLAEEDSQFHLELNLDADLANVPSLLNDVVHNEPVIRTINRIHDLKGRASAKVVLGESLDDIQTMIDVTDMNLSAAPDFIPFPVKIETGRARYQGSAVTFSHLRATVDKSYASDLSGQIDWQNQPFLDIQSGETRISLTEVYPWIQLFGPLKRMNLPVKKLSGSVKLSTANLKGPLQHADQWQFNAAGNIDQLVMTSDIFDLPITFTGGTLRSDQNSVSFYDSRIGILDASLTASGSLSGYLTTDIQSATLTATGDIGKKSAQWLSDMTHLPVTLNLDHQISISRSELSWEKQKRFSLTGDIVLSDGPRISANLVKTADKLKISRLKIEDDISSAVMKITSHDQTQDLSFKGNLEKSTIDQIIRSAPFVHGGVQGDFQAHLSRQAPLTSSLTGQFKANDLVIPLASRPAILIRQASIQSQANRLYASSATLSWDGFRYNVQGNIDWSPEGVQFDMDLACDELNVDKLILSLYKSVESPDEKPKDGRADITSIPFHGTLKVNANRLMYGSYTWSPFLANALLSDNENLITVTRANLCGIDTPGSFYISPQNIRLTVMPSSKASPLDKAVSCLLDNRIRVDGTFDADGQITTEGRRDELTRSLQGKFEFNARDGRIYHLGLMSKIFSVINITEIFAGNLPDLAKEGFAYDSIHAKATIKNGICDIDELIVDGSSMKIACIGSIDLEARETNLTVLVSPLKTVDRLIEKLPLIGGILEGTLISIPVQVTGNLSNPVVVPLSPVTIGTRVLELMKRILKAPVKIIQPFLPAEKSE
ncbi:MAG: AsmA-like C-terminal domain-containing protein [Desulfobacterales bacterium]|nr:AsmA-like C-terminal domain-containing protein [Desulfobacterales bacterium]